jgi:hypothetical protein
MRVRPVVLATLVALATAPAILGQERATVEIAPFIGYRWGGSVGDTFSAATYGIDGATSAGMTVSVSVGKTTAIELLFSKQDTGVDVAAYPDTQHHALTIDHLMAGAVGEFPGHGGRVHPFMEAYVGLTRIESRDPNGGYSTYGSAALGGGVKFDLSRHLAARLDARAYLIFVNSSAAAACGGGCAFAFTGDAMLQGEVAASLVLKL